MEMIHPHTEITGPHENISDPLQKMIYPHTEIPDPLMEFIDPLAEISHPHWEIIPPYLKISDTQRQIVIRRKRQRIGALDCKNPSKI